MSNADLWTGLGLINHLQARLSGSLPQAVSGVSIDTRTLGVGDLFFAIKGEHSTHADMACFDCHDSHGVGGKDKKNPTLIKASAIDRAKRTDERAANQDSDRR